MRIPNHNNNPTCSCKECISGKVAFWKAFLGKPISEREVEEALRGAFSSHMFSVPCVTGVGELNRADDGVFGWGN